FMAQFIWEARVVLGKASCVGNFNTGHWGPETVDYFPRTLQALQEDAETFPDSTSVFCFHEYNWPLLRDDEHWHTGKFLRAMPPIWEQYPDVRFALTEVGIDRAAREWGAHEGFRMADPDINVAIDMYCGPDGLAWYNDRLIEAGAEFALIFGCGMLDWRTKGFDIMNSPDNTAVPNLIGQYPVEVPPDPEPNGGVMMDVRIYDFDGIEQGWDWLIATFGDVQIRPIEDRIVVNPGDRIYKVSYIRAKRGDSACQINVRDERGNPIVGETVVFGWPDAPPHELPATWDLWTNSGEVGETNETGDVGPGMGIGAYYDPTQGERGPHFCWVWNKPSDYVDGIGMLALTDHDHPDIGYQEVVWGEEEEPDPGEPGEALAIIASIRVELDQLASILGGLDAKTEAMAKQLQDMV
ncbi:MAG: hypothetical protein ABIG63_12880, partial [Chloroflexota bacterium]